MLTASQISDVVRGLGSAGMSGRTAALRRVNQAGATSGLTLAQERFLTAAEQTPRSAVPPPYAHPAALATVDARHRGDKPISPVELAWINRLPTDPAAVPFDDARRVFSMANAVTAPDEVQLMRSIADPIREFHDDAQAQADLTRAEASEPVPAPPETLGALADAVTAENNQLRPDEAINRASQMLTDLGQERLAEHAQTLAAARARVDQVTQTTANRRAVHR